MKSKQIKMMFFLLIVVSALILRPSKAQIKTSICSRTQTRPIDNVDGCFDAVRLAADVDIKWLSRDCCKAVKTLDDCLLLVFPNRAYNTNLFKEICFEIFNNLIL
ncbi:hypothetical protein AtNW77_Chr3g0155531 [Arabidopsis thaliana]|uniref:ECA1-like gametogenesis related family protein n=2 Tax=Arabidopsis TaxID=3701 RepID=A8MQI0_ARATH|nr:ECA1-like gametogenesis related family protein [Arabidopsis thaliana]AEE73641.1 ECA1-like gametogenesis related family protein [Arabidopsis thaliana]KAG7623593.1 hypothetical protein ISN45_At03g000470 [Arabidopsis thaliana x Arabidopsis arenosa]|eukprot:NP_001078080.1 ECA1-like gametogenesis related family protein [Arabidopsis thaliana]